MPVAGAAALDNRSGVLGGSLEGCANATGAIVGSQASGDGRPTSPTPDAPTSTVGEQQMEPVAARTNQQSQSLTAAFHCAYCKKPYANPIKALAHARAACPLRPEARHHIPRGARQPMQVA